MVSVMPVFQSATENAARGVLGRAHAVGADLHALGLVRAVGHIVGGLVERLNELLEGGFLLLVDLLRGDIRRHVVGVRVRVGAHAVGAGGGGKDSGHHRRNAEDFIRIARKK